MTRRKIALLTALVLLVLPLAGRAGAPVTTQSFGSSAVAGSSTAFNPNGSTTCSILFTSGGGSTVTVQGAANSGSGVYATNTNFGSNGKIANPAIDSVWTGDISHFSAGFKLLWAGNSSTLSGSVTCFGEGASAISETHGSTSPAGPAISMDPEDPPTYFPLATSTPFLVTNSGTPSGTVAPWAFEATSTSCASTDSNILMQWENNSGATPGAAYLLCNGNFNIIGAYTGSGSGLTGGYAPRF